MEQPAQILLIEDNPLFVELTQRMLAEAKSGEFRIECVDNLAAGLQRLLQGGIDAVLLDLTLPDSNGLETFLRLHGQAESVPTIIYTSVDDEDLSLSALNHGAADYLVKSEVNANWLGRSLIYAIQRNRLSQEAEEGAKPDAPVAERTISVEQSSTSETRWIAKLSEKRLVSGSVLEQMQARLLSLLRRSNCQEVCVDLSQVEYIANAAISTLLIVHKRSGVAEKRFVLCEMNPQVYEQFSSRHFDKVFDIQRK
jgi:DNA-binding response OmpR family regulator